MRTMAGLTLRELPEDLIERIKAAATLHGRSVEEEIRILVQDTFAAEQPLLEVIEDRWRDRPKASRQEIREWLRD